MSDRVDRKLEEVAVAHYNYRHEAEFGAGFLEDAGIPYRLQMDDPGLGAMFPSSAVLWVRGVDAARARAVLEIDDRPAYLRGSSPGGSQGARRVRKVEKVRSPRRARAPEDSGGRRFGAPAAAGSLPWRERGTALVGGGGLLAAARLLIPPGADPAIAGTVVFLASTLVIVGLVGWAPPILRDILGALSGKAP